MTRFTQHLGAQSLRLASIVVFASLAFIPPISLTADTYSRRFVQNSQDVITLEPGKSIDRELKAGETHRYAITLAVGQYLQVSVEQKGIDVKVEVAVPNKEQADFNDAQSQTSREEIFLYAEQSGVIHLNIKSALANTPTGKYQLMVEALRPATEADRKAAQAQQLYLRANLINDRGKAEDIPTVIETFRDAGRLFDLAGKTRWAAKCLKSAGIVSFGSGNLRQAYGFFSQALPLARANGGPADLAGVLNDLGLTTHRLGNLKEAAESFQEALQIQRAIGNRTGEAITLNNLGQVLIDRGEIEKGAQLQEQSLSLRRELGDERGVARMLNNLANVYIGWGQIERGMEMRLQSLALRRKLKDKPGEASTLNQLAGAYAGFGENRKAVEHYTLAIELW